MRSSFYTAAAGAAGNMQRISVISNNMANVNTNGYKSKNSVFSDLIYTALAAQNDNIEKGHGIRMDKTDSLTYQPGALNQTGRDYDFAIEGPGFFGLLDPDTDNTIYTRDGSFEPVMGNLSCSRLMVRMKAKRLMWPGLSVFLKSQYRMGWMSWATMFMAYQTKMVKYIHRPT